MRRDRSGHPFSAVSLFAMLALATLSGCQSGTAANAKEEKLANDTNAIAVRSGGNWEKLTPQEKTFMTNVVHGNEGAAKNLLHALSGATYEGKWGKPGDAKAGKPVWAGGAASPGGQPPVPGN